MRTFIFSIIIATYFTIHAQELHPEASLTLTMRQGGGANGIAVAYNPSQKIYYTAIAGSEEFPLECFSDENNIYEGKTGFDARGLWYNGKTKSLEGNSFGGKGIYVTSLDKKGLPAGGIENKYPGSQPEDQSVGVYDASADEILFFDNSTGEVTRYKRTSGKKGKTVQLKDSPVEFESLNSAIIYTGQKNYEIGVYDYLDAKVYLFNQKGEYQTTVYLPDDAPYNETFNFSYANGYVFLFDNDMREWIGYKVF